MTEGEMCCYKYAAQTIKEDDGNVGKKRNEVPESLDILSTNCSSNELAAFHSFNKEDPSYESLFESDHWDDHCSEIEFSEGGNNPGLEQEISVSKVWNDNLEKSCGRCNYIENHSEFNKMIKCEGFCRRPYHVKCVGLKEIPRNRWKCGDCLNGLVFCNMCNKKSCKSTTGFLKCYHPLCMRYFHTNCLITHKSHLNSKFLWKIRTSTNLSAGKNACMQYKIFIGSIPLNVLNVDRKKHENDLEYTEYILREFDIKLICNRHLCDVCSDIFTKCKGTKGRCENDEYLNRLIRNKGLIKLDNPEDLHYCIRCNTSYHDNCLHPDSIKIAKGICICSRHVHDEVDMPVEEFNLKNDIYLKNGDFNGLLDLCKNKCIVTDSNTIDFECRIEALKLLDTYLSSSSFSSIDFSQFELPGQSKDWVSVGMSDSDDISDLASLGDNYGYTEIKRNVYVGSDDDCDGKSGSDEEKRDNADNDTISESKSKCGKNGRRGAKRKRFSVGKKQIANEKCTCVKKCEKDSCQNAAMFIECNSLICNLGGNSQNKNCMNRIFNTSNNKLIDGRKKLISKNLKVFDAKEKGLGVCCRVSIKKGEFVIEYVGEVLKKSQYLNRVEKYKTRELSSNNMQVDGNYQEFASNLVDIRERHWYCMEIGNDHIIDSTRMGNISRLINHSCEPNCVAQKWIVGNEYRVGIFSLRDIEPNEELTYDYSFTAYDIGFECKCNTKTCKGRIGTENFNRRNLELTKKRNALCRNRNVLNSFIALNKSLQNNPILYELSNLISCDKLFHHLNNDSFIMHNYDLVKEINSKKTIDNKVIGEYNVILRKHIFRDINIFPFDFKYRNSLYGYACLLYTDSCNIIGDWYKQKSKCLLLMRKPWIIFPFVLNNYEHCDNSININYLKRYNSKKVSIYLDKNFSDLSNNSLLWYLFDNGIGSDDCCKYCCNPGTLITCDYCYDSFHRDCLSAGDLFGSCVDKNNNKIKCVECKNNDLFSVYWLHTPNKRRRTNYFSRQRMYSLPLFVKMHG